MPGVRRIGVGRIVGNRARPIGLPDRDLSGQHVGQSGGIMSERDLTTSTSQVFGHVQKGTTCRICGRDVDDGREVYCSDYCRRLAKAVMSMLNWGGVRRQVIARDDKQCQECGFDLKQYERANDHVREIVEDQLPDRPEAPLDEIDDWDDDRWEEHWEEMDEWNQKRDELHEKYGNPDEDIPRLEVDHITPISEGGHPFDPGNLQTLCVECHKEKTAAEASERADRRTPSRGDMSESLLEYVSDGGEAGMEVDDAK